MKITKPAPLLISGALIASAWTMAAAAHDHAGDSGHAAHQEKAKPAKKADGTTLRTVAGATLRAADGSTKGLVLLSGKPGAWQLKADMEGLPPGEHGAHLHAVGKCEGPDFTSAGPHLNPDNKLHGRDNPQGAHLGDLPNVTIDADGKGTLTATLAGTKAQLFDEDGTAVVVHASADDYRTDPSGNSGGRIACGVLMRSR